MSNGGEPGEQSDELTNYDVVVRAERGSMGMRLVALEALRDKATVERLSGKLPLSPLRLVFPEAFAGSGTRATLLQYSYHLSVSEV